MTWSPEINSAGHECDKIAHLVVPYTRGRGLDIGCGTHKCWPHFIGVDNGHHWGTSGADVVSDASDLSLFADGSMDFVFSSHLLEHIPLDRVGTTLSEWARILKVGGNLVLYVPSANLYPKVGEPGANPDHKWNINPHDIERLLFEATGCGWTQVECEERDRGTEYSLFEVYRKRDDGRAIKDLWQRNPGGRKRALVIRYGAIGDQIMASSVLPLLKARGYHITYNAAPAAQEVVRHDPNIEEWLIQDKDQVPNAQLGPYWEALEERYDRIINLCESVEGSLLALPGRLNHRFDDYSRRRLMDVNYLERTHDIAGVPYQFNPRFYMTDDERKWARETRREMGAAPVVLWAITGSSIHKVYPWTNVVTKWLLASGVTVVLSADPGIGRHLQGAIMETVAHDGGDVSQLYGMAGKWSVRESLSFAQSADCVVGPETGLLNAVCMEDLPKVIYLSHSSAENLTKRWRNVITLSPDASDCPCFPCHRMHYDWTYCHQDEETKAALCASSIKPETLFRSICVALRIPADKAA